MITPPQTLNKRPNAITLISVLFRAHINQKKPLKVQAISVTKTRVEPGWVSRPPLKENNNDQNAIFPL
jgi:hypothetical protein